MTQKPGLGLFDEKWKEATFIGGLTLISTIGFSYFRKSAEKKSPNKKAAEPKVENQPAPVPQKQLSLVFDFKIDSKYFENTKGNSLLEELKYLESPSCDIVKIPHLLAFTDVETFPDIHSPLLGDSKFRTVFGGEGFLPEAAFIDTSSFVLSQTNFSMFDSIDEAKKFLRGGPRKNLYFDPKEVRACIVTCGGLCPGLNVVVREIVMSLYYNYNVREIYGIQFGYKGFYNYEWVKLEPNTVKKIHQNGGTFLGSSRGGFDKEKILKSLLDKGINQVYAIGGDGTHRGIFELFKEVTARKLNIAICGIPKTIDNDIPLIDRSFGFETCVEEAQRAITSGEIEASAAEYGVGLIKLMGRNAGFIAMWASLASRDVNICLVPEFPFELYGERGLLSFIYSRVLHKKRCVLVVAEGAGAAMKDAKLPDEGKDASGNVKPGDIGLFLRDEITKYCKSKGMDLTLKYIDPTYMIRTVPANARDKYICSFLAQSSIDGMMAGWTGFTTGNVNNRPCYIPISELTKRTQKIAPEDRGWQRLLASTGQPSFINEEEKVAKDYEKNLKQKGKVKNIAL
mmetsp:Transcript_54212/g.62348  ORF Transcript_54212/g.62348 Transcript_54212/m.62348 type:complete len:568 (-) Transcript_54212:123-1826(-)